MYHILAYIRYWLLAVNEHSLHSPFLFSFYQNLIKKDSSDGFEAIEAIRKQLLLNREEITINELGAGSRVTNSNQRQVAEIAKHSSTPPKFSRLLNRMIVHFNYQNIVELGTSLGLNTLYMAKANDQTTVTTFEGIPAIAGLAKKNFESLNSNNIEMVEGNIDQTLKTWLTNSPPIDLVYMDANHRYEPTLRYFELLLPKMTTSGMIILDDIHWSKEMNEAWKELIKHPEVSVSIDLFEAGILFLKKDLMKQSYMLDF